MRPALPATTATAGELGPGPRPVARGFSDLVKLLRSPAVVPRSILKEVRHGEPSVRPSPAPGAGPAARPARADGPEAPLRDAQLPCRRQTRGQGRADHRRRQRDRARGRDRLCQGGRRRRDRPPRGARGRRRHQRPHRGRGPPLSCDRRATSATKGSVAMRSRRPSRPSAGSTSWSTTPASSIPRTGSRTSARPSWSGPSGPTSSACST